VANPLAEVTTSPAAEVPPGAASVEIWVEEPAQAVEIAASVAPTAVPVTHQPTPQPAAVPPVEHAFVAPKPGSKTAIAVISIAGGVGKTTIAANLGRILSARKEHVLMVDATWASLLPFYFGAEDMRRGLRTFHSPAPGIPPIRILGTEHITHEWLEESVKPAMKTVQRTIFDIGPASLNLLPEILPLCAAVLIPLVVDLNSIMSIPRVEAYAKSMEERGLDVPKPLYFLNKLDATSEREQQGRELIARQVGNRLLPITIRRSAAVTEAIVGRMTVADYAPESEVANDFSQLALWIQKAMPIALPVAHAGRWSEA